MMTHKQLKAKALARPGVRKAYDACEEDFSFLDAFLKARSKAGITQAELASRIGTTQSVVARLESGGGKHSPSIATLQKYAHALGCRLELKLVEESSARKERKRRAGNSVSL
jgi:transcriptional regulator with XRE-family HTH domain